MFREMPGSTRTLSLILSASRLLAQTPVDQPIYGESLRDRMQRSVSRQLESAARMQASVELQRQLTQRQTGDVSGAAQFFSLPAPSHMTPPRIPAAASQPVEGTDDGTVERDNAPAAPEPSQASDAPPAHLMPLIPIPNIPTPGIADIAAITGVSPLIGSSMKILQERAPEGAVASDGLGSAALRKAAIPYMQQLLQALGTDGPALAPGLVTQQGPAGSYSGRDKAPLTSFSLVDWLFGL